MKILSCYIENYGAICRKHFDFNGGLTSFCRENGYGKTTLAGFIKAMFYGLESDRANIEFCERRHFYPFAGGTFGGNLTFTMNGDKFKIERTFDQKSQTRDTLTVYRNGEKFSGFCGNVGESVFGIDKASFERTIFIDESRIEIASTGSINAKLNNFAQGASEDGNTQSALERIEKKSKEYKKSRQGNDLISAQSQRFEKLNARIAELESTKSRLPEMYDASEKLEERKKHLQDGLAASQQIKFTLKDWEHYDSLEQSAQSYKQVITLLEGAYPGGIPSAEEVSALSAALAAERVLSCQTVNLFTLQDGQELERLEKTFGENIPSEEQIEKVRQNSEQILRLETNLEALKNSRPTKAQENLAQRFSRGAPDGDRIKEIERAQNNCRRARQSYEETPDYAAGNAPCAPVPKKKYALSACFFALIAAAGAALIFFMTAVGIALLAAGVICLILTGFLFLNKKSSAVGAVTRNPQKEQKLKEKTQAELKLQSLLAPYGYSIEKGAEYAADMFKSDLNAYFELQESMRGAESETNDILNNLNEIKSLTDKFFGTYNIEGESYTLKLGTLKEMIARLHSLSSKKLYAESNNREQVKKIEENRQKVREICAKYSLPADDLQNLSEQLERDARRYAEAVSLYNTKKSEALAFKKEKNLYARPDITYRSDGEITQEIEKINAEKTLLSNKINLCEENVEKAEELKTEREDCLKLLERYKSDYKILTATADMLKIAERKLKDKYIAPIKDKFTFYARALERALGEKVTMTTNFEIRYERNGNERSERHLSSGQRSLCSFCFRMALIENMYVGEKPFIILDDPFANLDGEHLKKVRTLLEELSQRMQIIYFTCHESRAL